MKKCELCNSLVNTLNGKNICRECEEKLYYWKYKSEKDYYNRSN